MSYTLILKPGVQDFISKLPLEISARIIKKFEQILENLFRYFQHFEGDFYELRIGDYRALIDIDFKEKILIVQVIDKRGRIFKRN